jgi:hypothetical protein
MKEFEILEALERELILNKFPELEKVVINYVFELPQKLRSIG